MRTFVKKLTSAAVALCAVAVSIPETQAAKVTLDGFGYYALKKKVTYYGNNSVPKQSGRYKSLGSDYYHKLAYQMDFITNRSNSQSGSLSWEFWAMPYLGSTSGIIIMTRQLQPFGPRKSFKNLEKEGLGIYIDRKRFPEMNLWEYTRKGWQFRDALSFTRKTFL